MAKTPSTMIPLGTKAPDFRLLDTCSDKVQSLAELQSNTATVIMFICNHCPYVKLIQQKIVEKNGIKFIAICSNDAINYPADAPDKMRQEAKDHHYPFPYLYDETQEVAKAYQAACTPDFYVFDKDLLCIYRGRFDDATPGNGQPVTGRDLCAALDCVIAGKPVEGEQVASVGCNIKWKK